MNSPCKNCICKPICRNKMYMDLMRECNIITKFFTNCLDPIKRNPDVLNTIERDLDPIYWYAYEVTSELDNSRHSVVRYKES